MKLKPVLTIAGSDSSGGAGIQADLKTMLANGVFGMSAVTALTAQNTQGVTDILEASPEFLKAEIDAVFTDIPPAAVKVGMVASVPLIRTIAACLREYRAEHVVVDPVMVATSGARLIAEDAVEALTEELFPLAEIITPNLPELEVLAGYEIKTADKAVEAAKAISEKFGCAVLAKGGHAIGNADDYLVWDGGVRVFRGEHIDTKNTHGTGCTLSSAIASNLAKGAELSGAVEKAKAYVTGAIAAGLELGHGNGPLAHGFDLTGTYIDV